MINRLFKAEVIWQQRFWPGLAAVEMATLRWADWFNNQRLFGPISSLTPAKAEADTMPSGRNSVWQHDSNYPASGKTVRLPRAVQIYIRRGWLSWR